MPGALSSWRTRVIALMVPWAVTLSGDSAVARSHPRDLRLLFDDYIAQHGKAYADEHEKETRFNTYRQTSDYIYEHNRGPGAKSYYLRHTAFSDFTPDELSAFLGSWWHPDHRMTTQEEDELFRWGDYEQPPSHIDWRTGDNPLGRGIITRPQNQGRCGACWAFVAASVVESAVAVATGMLTPLSAQQLIDCDTMWNAGCYGGNPIQAYDYIMLNGLTTADAYPYAGDQTFCRNAVNPVSSIRSYRLLRAFDEDVIMKAVARQPVAVGISGQHPSFLFYGGGIYDDPGCGTELNHALVIVGYGEEKVTGRKYWTARNSWGEGWGERGYIRLARQSGSKKGSAGVCGLAMAPSIPVGAYGGNVTALKVAQGLSEEPSPLEGLSATLLGRPDVLAGLVGVLLMVVLTVLYVATRRTSGWETPVAASGNMGVYVHPATGTYYQVSFVQGDEGENADSSDHPFRTGTTFATQQEATLHGAGEQSRAAAVSYSAALPQSTSGSNGSGRYGAVN